MKAVIAQKAPRLILTLLLAVGLVWPILGALNLEVSLLSCLEVCVLEALLLEAVGFSQRSALWGSLALALLGVIWLSSGGAATVTDLFRAFSLQLSGVPGAIPLVAREASLAVTVLFTLLSFLFARKSAGGIGAMMLLIGSMLLLWLTDRPDLIPRLLPAAAAALSLMLLGRHQEASPARILPWAAALVLLAFLLTPSRGIVFPSLKDRADALRQAVLDRLFFTEPRDVFSLSSEGYYPQGVSQLGGPVSPTDHPVMQVSTPRTVYLRGVLLNDYDGRSWRNTTGGRRYLWEAGSMASQRAALFDMNLPASVPDSSLTEASEVSVRMLEDGASTLFTPQRVRALRAGGDLVPYFTNSSELFLTRNLKAGDTWSVSAPLFLAGDPGLGAQVDAAAAAEDARWDSVLETYTALPGHLEEPVWQLAADITEGLETPYEKALAIQNYLAQNYRYTLDVAYQPSTLDFVTNFLFNTKEGYCTYFASAMTVLCRMAGLPARYAEGYLAQPDARGEALVTGLNAHAWTEVYFRGFGWLTFDATPRQSGTSEESDHPAEAPTEELFSVTASPAPPDLQEATPAPTAAPEPEYDPDPETGGNPNPDKDLPVQKAALVQESGSPWLWIAALILAGLAGGCALRWLWTAPARKERKSASEQDRFDLWMDDVLNRLSAAGHARKPGETLMSFTRRLDGTAALPVQLSQLGECASLLHYGRVHALPTDTALARNASRKLQKSLPRRDRLRYAKKRLLPSRRPGSSGRTPA